MQNQEQDLIDKAKAEIIVDLYELRRSLTRPMKAGELQSMEEMRKYNFIEAIIANITDKYNVHHEVIEEEMRRRTHDKDHRKNFIFTNL